MTPVATPPDIDPFYVRFLADLSRQAILRPEHTILVVAGGPQDAAVLHTAGFQHVTITNLDDRLTAADYAPYAWENQDAEALTYPDDHFDFALIHWGLHHCYSPHTGLLEMYRVARRGVILFEPHDNWLTRLGTRLGYGQMYETEAVFYNNCTHGGVKNSPIPNYVYRFNRRELIKTISAYAPYASPDCRCAYDLAPGSAVSHQRSPWRRYTLRPVLPLLRLAARLFPSLSNRFAAVILKPDLSRDLFPWLRQTDGRVALEPAYLHALYTPLPPGPPTEIAADDAG